MSDLKNKFKASTERMSAQGSESELLVLLDTLSNLEPVELHPKLKQISIERKIPKKVLEQQISAIRKSKRKQNKENKEDFSIKQVSSIILGDKLYEQIYIPKKKESYFVHIEDGQIQTTDRVIIDGIEHLPLINEAIDMKAIKLPTSATQYKNTMTLVNEIKDHIHKWLDVSPLYETLAAWYVLLSWLYDCVHTIPYLRALGDTGTGKSRFLDVIGGLCYKPCMAAGAITPAPIYRMIRQWNGSIILDEADFKDSGEKNEVITILNSGFEKNRPVIRCDKNDPNKLEYHPTYGPKIIATRQPFKDKALEARCFTEVTSQTSRTDIPFILTRSFYDAELELRNKLLTYRLLNFGKIDTEVSDEFPKGIEPRLQQVSKSFIALFRHDEEMYQGFMNFLTSYQDEIVSERAESFDGMIVKAIFNVWNKEDQDPDKITSKLIAEDMNEEYQWEKKVTPQRIGKRLKSLGITINRDMTGRYLLWDDEEMAKLKSRYIVPVREGKR